MTPILFSPHYLQYILFPKCNQTSPNLDAVQYGYGSSHASILHEQHSGRMNPKSKYLKGQSIRLEKNKTANDLFF